MNNDKSTKRINLPEILTWGFGFLGVVICLIIPWLFANNDPLYPLPGLYFIEIGLIGIVGYTGAIGKQLSIRVRYALLWSSCGVLLAFVILGALSVGPGLLPGFIGFTGVVITLRRSTKFPYRWSTLLLLIGALVQAALMLLLVHSNYS